MHVWYMFTSAYVYASDISIREYMRIHKCIYIYRNIHEYIGCINMYDIYIDKNENTSSAAEER